MKRKGIILLLIVIAWIMQAVSVQADEKNGQLDIDIHRINQNKTKVDTTDHSVEGTEDLFTDESLQLDKEIRQKETDKKSETLHSLFRNDFMEQQTPSTDQLFKQPISLSNIQQEETAESPAISWLFVTIIALIISLFCTGLFLLLKKLSVGETHDES